MLLVLLAFLLGGCLFGQSSLKEFLSLTSAQTIQVQQLNATFDQFTSNKQQRRFQVQQELDAEYAKALPDARSLGERYLELDGITREIAEARTGLEVKVAALLTEAQKSLLRKISVSIVQQNLIRDAGCGYLTDAVPFPAAGALRPYFGAVNSGLSISGILLGDFTTGSLGCTSDYPISIREYLALSDAQINVILNRIAVYQNLYSRKQDRIADLQVEIRDETAKPVPDPTALGVRYAELIGISQEVRALGSQAGTASRALLTVAQLAKLQALMDANSLSNYILPAESCHFIAPLPGLQSSYYAEASCPRDF